MFATGIRQNLNAYHFLRGDFGEESSPHSHPYQVELICRTPHLDAHGFSTDIDLLEAALSKVLSEIDKVLLNDLPFFHTRQPSLENLCMYLFYEVKSYIQAEIKQPAFIPHEIEIRIWESETAWASYTNTIDLNTIDTKKIPGEGTQE